MKSSGQRCQVLICNADAITEPFTRFRLAIVSGMSRAWSIALALLLLFTSCGPRFKPHYDPDANWFGHLTSVPIITLVKIEPGAVRPIGKPFTDDGVSFPVQLLRTDVVVENVFRGDLKPGPTKLFYISSASAFGTPKLGFYVAKSFYDLLLLRKEKGKLRTICDISLSCNAPILSGSHVKFKPKAGVPLDQTLIDLLLTRGEGATDTGMAQAIFGWWAPFISLQYTTETLLRLANSETPIVRSAACLEFRDILAEDSGHIGDATVKKQLAQQFGIPNQYWPSGPSYFGRTGWPEPGGKVVAGIALVRIHVTITSDAARLKGLDLCMNDAALGVPPLHN